MTTRYEELEKAASKAHLLIIEDVEAVRSLLSENRAMRELLEEALRDSAGYSWKQQVRALLNSESK
jgi:hypothetical protein